MASNSSPSPFLVKDCALATLATGIKAQNLLQLKDKLSTIQSGSIYFHFWGGRLRTTFEYREYHNDFSFFAHKQLHDDILAERLELLNPREYSSLEDLRSEIIDILDNRIEEEEGIFSVKSDEEFHFMSSKIVVFHTPYKIIEPKELVSLLPKLTNSSLFYHFIDSARRLSSHGDDFSSWLSQFGNTYEELIKDINKIDPYFISLYDLHQKLINIFSAYFIPKIGKL